MTNQRGGNMYNILDTPDNFIIGAWRCYLGHNGVGKISAVWIYRRQGSNTVEARLVADRSSYPIPSFKQENKNLETDHTGSASELFNEPQSNK